MSLPYCRVTQQVTVPKLGSACVLAHSSTLGYLAGVDAGQTVALYSVLPAPIRLCDVTPPTAGLDFSSWATIAASGDAVCLVYGASYNGSSRLTKYLQVWRNGVLSPPLELVHNYVSEYYASEKSRTIWTGTHWLVSTRVQIGSVVGIQFQRVSADGSEIVGPTLPWTHGPWMTGASMVQQGRLVYATGLTSNNVDRRTVRLATIDLDTFTIVDDQQVDDGTWAFVDTAVVGLNGVGLEVLWYCDGRLDNPPTTQAAIYSRISFGQITERFPKGGDLSIGVDSRLIVTKDAHAALVAQVSSTPTILTPWDGVTPEYRASCASSPVDWLACATVGNQTRFWQLALTDVPPDPVIPPIVDRFRPISEPSPAGTVIPDLARYFIGKPETFPRIGTHPITQYLDMKDGLPRLIFGKFYDPNRLDPDTGQSAPFLSKRHYEEMRVGATFLHQIADISNDPEIIRFTQTQWYPRRMQVGYDYVWQSPLHEAIKMDRRTCQQVGTPWDYRRIQGVLEHWARFEAGRDFPDIDVIQVLYDPTDGIYAPDRHLEVGWYGRDIGPLQWESHRTAYDPVLNLPGCYDTGTLVLNEQTLGVGQNGQPMRSTFYRKGGVPWVPEIAPCELPISPENPPVEPPVTLTDRLMPGQILYADKPLRSGDTRFMLLYQSDGNLVLYGPRGPLWATMTNGQSVGFCAMQGDGNFVVYDKAVKPRWASNTNGQLGAWLLVQNDGNLVIYSASGKPVWASNTVYQPPAPIPIPPSPAPILTIRGRQFFDGDKLWVPRMASDLSPLVRPSSEQIIYLDRAQAKGHNGVRAFAGALTWAGQTPEIAQANLPAFLQAAKDRGLAVEVTAVTDSATGYDVPAHLTAVVAICQAAGKHVLLELANEVGHGSQASWLTADWLRQWGKANVPAGLLWAVGATSPDEPSGDPATYGGHGGNYCTAHLDRGRDRWDNVRRVRETYAIIEAHGVPAINNEPMGADEQDGSVTGKQRWNDPALFFCMGALERGFGTGGVHHSQAGLWAELPGPVQEQCASAYVLAHGLVASVLPGLVGAYKNVNHDGSPIVDTPYGDQPGAKVVRAYSFVSGNKDVSVFVGAASDFTPKWGNGWQPVRELGRMLGQDGLSCVIVEAQK